MKLTKINFYHINKVYRSSISKKPTRSSTNFIRKVCARKSKNMPRAKRTLTVKFSNYCKALSQREISSMYQSPSS